MNHTKSTLRRMLVRTAVAAAVATAVAGVAIQASAGAAARPPFVTSTTVTGPSTAVTGQAVTFTATVKATPKSAGTPYGQVVFTVTGSGGYSANCDSGDTVTLSPGGKGAMLVERRYTRLGIASDSGRGLHRQCRYQL